MQHFYRTLLLPASFVAFLCLPPDAAAEMQMETSSARSMAESGSTLPTAQKRLTDLLERLPARKEQYRKQLTDADEEETRRIQERLDARKRLSELWKECRELLRRANRDTKFGVFERCLRAQLLLEHATLRQELPSMEKSRGISDSTRMAAVEKTQELMDAMMAVTDAIDAHVFHTESDLQEMRQKLREQFRIPYWVALAKMRANRIEGFITLIARKLQTVVEDYPHIATEQSDQILTCLEQSAAELHMLAPSVDLVSLHTDLLHLRSTTAGCSLLLEDLIDSLAPATPSQPSETPKQ